MRVDLEKLDKNLRHLIEMRRRRARYALLRGGTRSGKTYAALRFIALNALAGVFRRCSVVSESIPHLRRGALRDFEQIVSRIRGVDITYKQSTKEFIFPGGTAVEFFSADDSARLRGAQRDWLFVNEVNLLDEKSFNELDVRTRDFVIADFNPVSRFWLNTLLESMGINIADIEVVTTYRDNPYLDTSQKEAIERRMGMREWWQVYGTGEWGNSQGQAWYAWEAAPVDWGDWDYVGVDFGEGRSPSAIIGVRWRGGDEYEAKQIYYGRGGLHELADVLRSVKAKGIFADSAQLDYINALRKMDLDVRACIKKHLVASFALLNSKHFYLDTDSPDLLREARELSWADRGAGLIKAGASDHAIDAVRYAFHAFLG